MKQSPSTHEATAAAVIAAALEGTDGAREESPGCWCVPVPAPGGNGQGHIAQNSKPKGSKARSRAPRDRKTRAGAPQGRASCGPDAKRTGRNIVRVSHDDEWVWADLATAVGPDSPWDLLAMNAHERGLAKIVLRGRERPEVLHVRAETGYDSEVGVAVDVSVSIDAVCAAAACLESPDDRAPESIGNGKKRLVESAEAEELCQAAEWHYEKRDGSFFFELDVPGAFLYARATPGGGGGLMLTAELHSGALPVLAARYALGVMLLRVAGSVRGVRAYASLSRPRVEMADDSNDDRAVVGLEAPLPAEPTAAQLRTGLEALSVAARMSLAEVHAVAADEGLARAYLTHHVWPALSERTRVAWAAAWQAEAGVDGGSEPFGQSLEAATVDS